MVFDLDGKIVLVTGGASGIGLRFAKELLRNKVKAVTLADVNTDVGEIALAEIENEFGPNKALFVKTDVTDIQQYEYAFKKTIEAFKHVDILVNNAGILNDKTWEKEVAININGFIHGMLLGMDNYLPKYKQGPEAIIVNMCSVAAVGISPSIPVYAATKAAAASMTRVWGDSYHYERTKVRVIGLCPGVTITPLIGTRGRKLGPAYEEWSRKNRSARVTQEPEHVAQEAVKLIPSAPSGTLWVIEGGEPAYQYIFPERESMAK